MLTYNADTYSFSLPEPLLGVANGIYSDQFYVTGVLIDEDGTTAPGQVNFYGREYRGGLQISSPLGGVYANGINLFVGDQATVTYPVFTLGTTPLYVFDSHGIEEPASITITEVTTSPSQPSTIPEPSSLTLLATGALGLGTLLRRKLV